MDGPADLRHDPAWLEGLRRGAPEALERAARTYSPMLDARLTYGFSTTTDGQRVRLRVHDPDEREEIVQETFSRAFADDARARYGGESDYGAYLLRICRNLAVDRFRRACAKRRVIAPTAADAVEMLAEAADASGPGRSPENQVAAGQVRALIVEFLATLDERDLHLLRLYSESDLSQRQAADVLGVERHAVRAMTASIRTRLLRFMKRKRAIDALEPEQLLDLVTATAAVLCVGLS